MTSTRRVRPRAAPVGLQRVEDYGAHERRELQANVFARELLLPRPSRDGCSSTKSTARPRSPKMLDLPGRWCGSKSWMWSCCPAGDRRYGRSPASARPRDDPAQDRAAAHRGSPFQLAGRARHGQDRGHWSSASFRCLPRASILPPFLFSHSLTVRPANWPSGSRGRARQGAEESGSVRFMHSASIWSPSL